MVTGRPGRGRRGPGTGRHARPPPPRAPPRQPPLPLPRRRVLAAECQRRMPRIEKDYKLQRLLLRRRGGKSKRSDARSWMETSPRPSSPGPAAAGVGVLPGAQPGPSPAARPGREAPLQPRLPPWVRGVGPSGSASVRPGAGGPPSAGGESPSSWEPGARLRSGVASRRDRRSPTPNPILPRPSPALGTDAPSSPLLLAFRECKQIRWVSVLSVE